MQGITAYFPEDGELLLWLRETAKGERTSLSQFIVTLVAQERNRRAGNEEAGMGKLYAKLDQHDRKLDALRTELLQELAKRPATVVTGDTGYSAKVNVPEIEYDLTGLGIGGFDD